MVSRSGPLRVLIPRGMARLATQSGIGEAIRHQEKAVRALGHTITRNPFGRFDVIHLNTPFPDTPLLALWARLRRRPVLMWAHSTEDDFRDSFTGANRIAPWFRRWISLLYRRGDVVLTPTAYARELISRPGYGIRRPIHVLSNGVDTDYFRPDPSAGARLRETLGLSEDAKVVMSVGLQMVRKGILEWIELARHVPEATFVWYGHTDPRMITKDVATAVAEAPANCLFPGYVQKPVLRDAYCGADVFCFLTREETEGIVLLEALACGAPTLVSDIPIYRDWLPEGKVVHKVHGQGPEKVTDAEQELRGLLEGRAPDLTEAGRAAAQEVDLSRVAARLQEIYDDAGVSAHDRDATARPPHRDDGQGAHHAAEH
jgi:1,2-diacylglycerol-3-alpha-glucose alpha-1,2-glucosyltransferase